VGHYHEPAADLKSALACAEVGPNVDSVHITGVTVCDERIPGAKGAQCAQGLGLPSIVQANGVGQAGQYHCEADADTGESVGGMCGGVRGIELADGTAGIVERWSRIETASSQWGRRRHGLVLQTERPRPAIRMGEEFIKVPRHGY
jgi:hypothetical protein